MRFLSNLSRSCYNNAYFMLIAAAWFWAGNTVAGRFAINEISPMALASFRWFIVLVIILPFTGRKLIQSIPTIKLHFYKLFWMSALGFSAFYSLIYVAALSTGAANLAIIEGATPAIVMLGVFFFFKTRIRSLQWLGLIVSFLGIFVIALKGSLSNLTALTFAIGDVWMFLAACLYAIYTLGLRTRMPFPDMVFFTVLAVFALITSLIPLGIEIYIGQFQTPTMTGWAILAYVSLFPSLISQVFYIRGVALIGPSRAGMFVNLVPIFGTLMAAMVPSEPFALYHVISLGLVLGGIVLAETGRS